MKRMSMCICAVLFAATGLSAQDQWWNKEWESRVPLTLNAGMNPAKGMMASAKIAGPSAKIDLNSARLIRADGKEIPCQLKKDTAGNYIVGWKPEDLKMMEKRTYCLYFSDTAKPAGPAAVDFPEYFPGMNLIPGAGFTSLDNAGHPEGWAMSSKGYGIKDKWSDQNKDQMKVVTVDNKKALELTANAVVHVKVKPDHQYKLSFEGKYDADRVHVTVWYRGKTIHEYLARELGVDNYKMQMAAMAKGKWNNISESTFIYLDKKTKQHSFGNKKLLKYTELAFINITVKNGKAWIANICYEDITDQGSLKVTAGEIEKAGN